MYHSQYGTVCDTMPPEYCGLMVKVIILWSMSCSNVYTRCTKSEDVQKFKAELSNVKWDEVLNCCPIIKHKCISKNYKPWL